MQLILTLTFFLEMSLLNLKNSLRCISLRIPKNTGIFQPWYNRNQFNHSGLSPIQITKRGFLNPESFYGEAPPDLEKKYELLNPELLRKMKESLEYPDFDHFSEYEFKSKFKENLVDQLEKKFKIHPAGLISLCDDLLLKDAFLFYNSIKGEFLKCNSYNFLNTLLELKYDKWLREKYQMNKTKDNENLMEKVMRITRIANLKSPSIQAYNLLLYFYSLNGNVNNSQLIFDFMIENKLAPDEISYILLMNAYASQKKSGGTLSLLLELNSKYKVNSSLPYSAVVKLGVLRGRPDEAAYNIKYMNEGIEPPTVLLNLLIDSYIHNNQISSAWQVYNNMKLNKGQTNELTYKLMLGACIKTSEFHKIPGLIDDLQAQLEYCNVLETMVVFFNTLANYPDHFKFYAKR